MRRRDGSSSAGSRSDRTKSGPVTAIALSAMWHLATCDRPAINGQSCRRLNSDRLYARQPNKERRRERGGGKEGRREGGKEGRREGGKEGRREGGKEGRREGGKEGRREGGKEGRREGGKEGRREGTGNRRSPRSHPRISEVSARRSRLAQKESHPRASLVSLFCRLRLVDFESLSPRTPRGSLLFICVTAIYCDGQCNFALPFAWHGPAPATTQLLQGSHVVTLLRPLPLPARPLWGRGLSLQSPCGGGGGGAPGRRNLPGAARDHLPKWTLNMGGGGGGRARRAHKKKTV